MADISGIHHVTAIAGDPQENLDFYAGVLGMRLVKKTVNQDMPGTYHLFYADAEGHPGADLTFFPWPDVPPARLGVGLGSEISLAIPPRSLEYWLERLARYGTRIGERALRRGERVLPITDPHGLELALVETDDAREFTPWDRGPVPEERQIRGLHAVRLWERDVAATSTFLTGTLGFAALGEGDGWHRFGVAGGGSGRHLEIRELPNVPRGAWGTGSMHHVAWRVADLAAELKVRERVAAARRRPTEVIDRFWFKSVYFTEPGGVLFELATDGPGFTADESLATLGEQLVLPPWLEPHRREIEAGLPPIRQSAADGAGVTGD
jgi:glyoxalase family protein